jgi:uncharacterized membrane protein YjdF
MLFTAAYMAAAVAGALATGNGEFIFYIVVMFVLLGAVFVVHRRTNLSDGVLWALSIWGALHMAGGLMPIPKTWPYNPPHNVLYSLWFIPDRLKYDQVIHFYGFAVTTWLCWEGLRNSVRGLYQLELRPTLGIAVICAAAGMGFGALNEIVEFIATLLVPETNVGGYENTGWDLVFNALGSISAGAFIYFKGASLTPTGKLPSRPKKLHRPAKNKKGERKRSKSSSARLTSMR